MPQELSVPVEDPTILTAMSSPDLLDWWFDYGCAEVAPNYPNLGKARAFVRAELACRGYHNLPDHEPTPAETEADIAALRKYLGITAEVAFLREFLKHTAGKLPAEIKPAQTIH